MFDNDKRKKIRVSVMAAALAALPTLGHAAGLGKLTVLSALGQPLRAELDISASREELASLTARVAPPEAFRQANVEYAGILSNVRLTIDKRPNGQPYFRVTSDRVISDPFLDMLVELNWSSGRLVREYTFLLDPPEMAKAPEAPAPVTAPVAAPAQDATAEAPAKSTKGGKRAAAEVKRKPRVAAEAETEAKPKPAAEPAPKAEAAEDAGNADTRAVHKGDTLGKIAAEMRPEGASLEQTLVALFRQNKSAFDGGNMNRLKAGKILTLPDKEAVAAVSAAEARKVVVAQSADFEAYKRKLAGAVAAAPAAKEEAAQQSGGKIAPKVEDKAPAATGKDKLQVSRTESAGAKAEEDRVAKEKALKEAQSRVAELEKNVADMRKLMELKNQAAADLQKQAAKQPAPEAKKPEVPAPAKPVEPPKPAPAVKPAEPPKAAETKPAEPPKPAEAAKAPETDKSAEQKPAAEEKPAAPPAPPKPKKPVVMPEPEPEPSFIEDNLPLVAGGGGVLALLLGYLGFKGYKRRKDAKAAEASTDSALSSSSVLDLSSSEAFSQVEGAPSEFGEIGASTFGTGEGVDPIREAETFMAYGRDAQAEEILVDALRKDATNLPVYLKLLEIYAARKSVFQFNAVAQDLRNHTNGQGAEWDKAVALGRVVDPDNPLYQDKTAAAVAPAEAITEVVTAAEPVPAAAPDLDFDLDLGEPAAPAPAEEAPAEPAPVAEPTLDITFEPVSSTPAAEPESAPAPAPEEVASLDFDLDLGESAPAAAPIAEASAEEVPAEAAPAAGGMDLDFDLGAPEVPVAAAPEAPAVAPSVDVGNMLDFDLDLGGPAEPAAPAAPSAPSAPSAPLSADMGGLDIDFDLSGDAGTGNAALPDLPLDQVSVPAAAAEPAKEPALDFDFDLGDMSLPLTETPSDVAPPLDLSGIDLNLPATAAEAASAAPTATEPAADEPENPEAATKLELAQAYEEMGDREGARELFQEVLAEGNASQQAAAREKLSLLG